MTSDWECIVVGGGAAGLSAALTLGRARRRTLVVDAGRQSNLAAHGVGGLLNHDRRPPAELYARGHEELAAYPSVTLVAGTVSDVTPELAVTLTGGDMHTTARLLLAGGMEYRHPALPGLTERWGDSVFHCPFCHGWEVAGGRLAVLNPDPSGVHQAILLTAWSDHVTLLGGERTAEERTRLAAAGVTVETRPATALRGPGTSLTEVELADGSALACTGLLVATTLHQRSDLAARLGVTYAPANPATSEAIEVDFQHRTSVTGVYAAGDVTPGPPSVSRAVAQGNFGGAMIVGSITGAM